MIADKILIVDDVEPIRRLARKVLEREGFRVVDAETGWQALDLIKNDRDISLVLLDIMLPDLDGLEVMELIKDIRTQQKRDIKVCYISGKKTKEDIRQAIEAGGDDYLVKPILTDSLIAKVNALLKPEKESQYAQLNVLYRARLTKRPIHPDIYVVRMSEDTCIVRSTAGFDAGLILDLACEDLAHLLGVKENIQLKVEACKRQRHGVYFVKTSYVGFTERELTKIRAMAVRGTPNAAG